ncbi:MAG: hypothetical protein AAGD33_09820 [Actinomycetota bacterium]
MLTDARGNVVPDGRAVRLTVESPDGLGTSTATTVGGVARFDLIAPRAPGEIRLGATSGPVSSPELVLTAEPAVGSVPVEIVRSVGSDRIEIGPITRPDGALVPDGTEVVIRGGDSERRLITVGGFARGPVHSTGGLTVEVLGVTSEVGR